VKGGSLKMAKKRGKNFVGSWAFLIGVILALILGFMGDLSPTIVWVLFVIGLIVGLLNIGDEETHPFLMSGLVLIIAGAFGGEILTIVPALNRMFEALLVIFVPATVIVAIRHVFSLAKH
jgi:hypothetical protein